MNALNTDELFFLLGSKEAELYVLRRELNARDARIVQLEAEAKPPVVEPDKE